MSQTMFGSLQESSEEGSGIIYSQDGYIVTNYHVIESAIKDSSAKISVTLADSDETIEASIVGYDETTDLAVIKVEKQDLQLQNLVNHQNFKLEIWQLLLVIH